MTLRNLIACLALLTSIACDNAGTEPEGGRSLMTANVKGTGTLTLTTLTSTRVAGTFTFEGRLALDGSGQRVSVTNGRFDMPNPLPFE